MLLINYRLNQQTNSCCFTVLFIFIKQPIITGWFKRQVGTVNTSTKILTPQNLLFFCQMGGRDPFSTSPISLV